MAIRFDAASDYVYRTSSLPAVDPFTFCTWAYIVTDRNARGWLFLLSSGAAWHGIELGTDGTTPRINLSGTMLNFASGLSTGTWYHLAYTRDGSSWTGYVNGNVAVGPSTSALGAFTPAALSLGSDATVWLDGRLADARLWTAALSQSEIQTEMRSAVAVRTSNLYADWRTPSGATRVNDFSGNDRHLTAAGTLADEDDPVYGIPVQAMHYARLRG